MAWLNAESDKMLKTLMPARINSLFFIPWPSFADLALRSWMVWYSSLGMVKLSRMTLFFFGFATGLGKTVCLVVLAIVLTACVTLLVFADFLAAVFNVGFFEVLELGRVTAVFVLTVFPVEFVRELDRVLVLTVASVRLVETRLTGDADFEFDLLSLVARGDSLADMLFSEALLTLFMLISP
jgi:hypothetical protein